MTFTPAKRPKQGKPWGLLGEIEFELAATPRSFNFTESATYAEHSRIENQPGLQWVGVGLKTIDLEFRFNAQWCDPGIQLRRLRVAMAQHQPMALVLGTGLFQGNFVISELRSNLLRTDSEGTTLEVEVTVSLKETNQSAATVQNPFRGGVFRKRL